MTIGSSLSVQEQLSDEPGPVRVDAVGLTEFAEDHGEEGERLRSDGGYAPFLTPRYLALWWQHLGQDARPAVLTAWRREELVGYAPFMVTKDRAGPLRLETLRFLGNNEGYPGDILYADVVVAADGGAQIADRLVREARTAVGASRWDLGYLDPRSPTVPPTREVLGITPRNRAFLPPKPYVSLGLPAAWEEYLSSLSGSTRQNYRRRLRKLRKKGEVTVGVESNPAGAVTGVRGLIANHLSHWEDTPKEGWFGGPDVHGFLEAAARLLAAQESYLAFSLELDGVPIAWNVGAYAHGRYFEQYISFDPNHARCSPGTVLSILVAEELIRRGATRIEYGPGFDARKRDLGGLPREFCRMKGYPGWLRHVVTLTRWVRKGEGR